MKAVAAALIVTAVSASGAESVAPAGYAQPVIDAAATSRITQGFKGALTDRGIPATILGCRLIEQVAVGVANSETAYGAACKLTIASKAAKEMVLCDSDRGGSFVLYDGAFVDTNDWMAGFIRRNCF